MYIPCWWVNIYLGFGSFFFIMLPWELLFLLTLISLIAKEAGINVEGGIFWKKLV
jgi:hypothetical protein